MSTVASKSLIVLEDPTLVNEPLLVGRRIGFLSENAFEGSNGGIKANLNGKLRTAGATDVDIDSISAAGFVRIVHSSITSHSSLLHSSQSLSNSKKKKNYRSMRERKRNWKLKP
ncbi:hypothetical protein ACJW30_08G086000 [Castanea mollissima]